MRTLLFLFAFVTAVPAGAWIPDFRNLGERPVVNRCVALLLSDPRSSDVLQASERLVAAGAALKGEFSRLPDFGHPVSFASLPPKIRKDAFAALSPFSRTVQIWRLNGVGRDLVNGRVKKIARTARGAEDIESLLQELEAAGHALDKTVVSSLRSDYGVEKLKKAGALVVTGLGIAAQANVKTLRVVAPLLAIPTVALGGPEIYNRVRYYRAKALLEPGREPLDQITTDFDTAFSLIRQSLAAGPDRGGPVVHFGISAVVPGAFAEVLRNASGTQEVNKAAFDSLVSFRIEPKFDDQVHLLSIDYVYTPPGPLREGELVAVARLNRIVDIPVQQN